MLIFADFHLHNYQLFSRPWKGGLTSRVKISLDTLEEIFKIAVNRGERVLVSNGDLFHSWQGVNTVLMSEFCEFFYDLLDRYSKYIDHVILVEGNHDLPNKSNPAVSLLNAFKGHPKVWVINYSKTIKLEDMNVLFIPYHDNLEYIRTELVRHKEKTDLLFAHTDVAGGQSSIDNYIPPVKSLHSEEFKGIPLSILGHYHMSQDFNLPSGELVSYVGSTNHRDKSDIGQEKYVYRVNKGVITERIILPGPKILATTIQEPPFPELSLHDWHWILCPRKLVRDIEKHYGKDLLFKTEPKDTVVAAKPRLNLKQSQSPIGQFVKYANKDLQEQTLVNIGNYYMRNC